MKPRRPPRRRRPAAAAAEPPADVDSIPTPRVSPASPPSPPRQSAAARASRRAGARRAADTAAAARASRGRPTGRATRGGAQPGAERLIGSSLVHAVQLVAGRIVLRGHAARLLFIRRRRCTSRMRPASGRARRLTRSSGSR